MTRKATSKDEEPIKNISYDVNEDPAFKSLMNDLHDFWKYIEDVKQAKEKLKAEFKQKEVQESRLAAELQLNDQLKSKLAGAQEQEKALKNMCEAITNIKLHDSDKERLEKAQDMIKICKKLTGIRFDYSAPSNMYRGYFKNEVRKVLEPFEIEEGPQAAANLWAVIEAPSLQDLEYLITTKVTTH